MEYTTEAVLLRKTALQLTLGTIQSLITGNGGVITIATSLYPDLNDLNSSYWVDHSPFGVPGDVIWLQEIFSISKMCQSNSGYVVTVLYEDAVEIDYNRSTASAITPDTQTISANSMEFWQSRCVLEITNTAINASDWEITTIKLP